MTNLDYAMGAGITFIALLTILIGMVHRRYIYPMAVLIVFMGMLWGNDICSRNDRIAFFRHHFEKGDAILCQVTGVQLLSISQQNGWNIKEHYALRGNIGIDLLEEECEVPQYDKPNCISTTVQILIAIGALGWMIIFFIRDFKRLGREQKEKKAERLEKIRQDREEEKKWIQGAELTAKEYLTDSELKEWSDFIGDIPQDYARSELYPFDEFAANIEVLLKKLSTGELEKIGIVYNDTLSAVVLPAPKLQGDNHG
ncbi:MAG: hypothetical protein PHO27_12675 [Sulfuricurvum sp.]|nr:hypothetical protein [Sulfuricurvum sp.]